jgi:hypothetical protein
MPFEKVEKIWDNGTAFIIGGGPSLRDFDFTPLHNRNIIGCNCAFMLGEWVDICWFGDSMWFDQNRVLLAHFPGLKYHCCHRHKDRPDTFRIARGKPEGIETDPYKVSWNNNTGASAINLAYHLGARKVILLGFDMKFGSDKENNWHNYYERLEVSKRGDDWYPYDRFLRSFIQIQKDAQKLDLEILNATPDSALTLFPMISFEEALLIK